MATGSKSFAEYDLMRSVVHGHIVVDAMTVDCRAQLSAKSSKKVSPIVKALNYSNSIKISYSQVFFCPS